MKNIDYYTWHLCFSEYRRKHSDTKLSPYFDDIEGEMKLKFVIEELYAESLQKEKLENLVEKLDKTVSEEDLERMTDAYDNMPNNEVLILNKLKTFASQNPDEPLSAQIGETTGLLKVLKKVKALLGDSSEDEIDFIIEDLNDELKEEGDELFEDEWMDDAKYDDLDGMNFESLDDMDDDDIIDNSSY